MESNKQIDEMQENKLLKIQERGFWITFWLLFIAIFVQVIIGTTFKEIAGEVVVLLMASIYIATVSLKNGLWTRKTRPTTKTNLLTSLVPAIILGVFWAVRSIVMLNKTIADCFVQIIIVMLSAYAICFVMLEILRLIYKKRREKLDNIDEDGRA